MLCKYLLDINGNTIYPVRSTPTFDFLSQRSPFGNTGSTLKYLMPCCTYSMHYGIKYDLVAV
jgi:hypothetical protein